jgi:hypothetical protein
MDACLRHGYITKEMPFDKILSLVFTDEITLPTKLNDDLRNLMKEENIRVVSKEYYELTDFTKACKLIYDCINMVSEALMVGWLTDCEFQAYETMLSLEKDKSFRPSWMNDHPDLDSPFIVDVWLTALAKAREFGVFFAWCNIFFEVGNPELGEEDRAIPMDKFLVLYEQYKERHK